MLSVGPTDDVTNQMVRRMKTTLHTTAGLAVGPYTSPARMGRITSPSGQLVRDKPLLRKYEVAHLTPSLHSVEFSKMAPVLGDHAQRHVHIPHNDADHSGCLWIGAACP